MMKPLAAEFIGTFALVSAVCGSALFSAGFSGIGSGLLGVALAVGITVMAMAYAMGPISGGHFNPAVTLGVWAGGKFEAGRIVPYIIAQVLGGSAAAFCFYIIASGKSGFAAGDFASNGYGAHSLDGYSLTSVLIIEAIITCLFVLVILGATDEKVPAGFAPIAIGLALAAFHIMAIPVSNASLNPARSTATALIAGGWALEQLWAFWIAPIAGGLAGGAINRWLRA